MISSSYIWSWHIWFSYDQPFLYLRSYVCVPIFIHGINGLPISVHRIIGFLMNSLPIIAFLYLRSYDCFFLYPCLPVERGGSGSTIIKNFCDWIPTPRFSTWGSTKRLSIPVLARRCPWWDQRSTSLDLRTG